MANLAPIALQPYSKKALADAMVAACLQMCLLLYIYISLLNVVLLSEVQAWLAWFNA